MNFSCYGVLCITEHAHTVNISAIILLHYEFQRRINVWELLMLEVSLDISNRIYEFQIIAISCLDISSVNLKSSSDNCYFPYAEYLVDLLNKIAMLLSLLQSVVELVFQFVGSQFWS